MSQRKAQSSSDFCPPTIAQMGGAPIIIFRFNSVCNPWPDCIRAGVINPDSPRTVVVSKMMGDFGRVKSFFPSPFGGLPRWTKYI
jgi:hypothetical protein